MHVNTTVCILAINRTHSAGSVACATVYDIVKRQEMHTGLD